MIQVDAFKLSENIRRTWRLIDNTVVQAVALADYFLTVIKARTPKKTGATAQSWTIHFHKKDRDGVIWEISPDGKEKEVTFLEFGTKPHMIVPSQKEVLRFEVDGEVVYAKKVMHPGTKPLGFVRLTQDDLDKSAKEIADRLISSIRSVWL
jgi:hypothetical protein